jgi:hypothetical protein
MTTGRNLVPPASKTSSSALSSASIPTSKLWTDYNEFVRCGGLMGKYSLDGCRTIVAIEEAIDAGERAAPSLASKAAQQIIGCYRARDCVDVETYIGALVATLARYPAPLVKMAACIENGIPRKHKFVPTIAEVADHLDAMSKNLTTAARLARRALQIEA